MNDTRLLLIEGLPGSGKSTTAQWLCHLFERTGTPARWYHEQDTRHPVYRFDERHAATGGTPAECEAYHARARERWARLVEAVAAGDEIVILDGSFLQTPLVSMQLAGCDTDTIARQVQETERIVSAASPMLIALRCMDTAVAFDRMRARRGAEFEQYLVETVGATSWGRAHQVQTGEGVLAAMRMYDTLIDRMLSTLQMPVLAIDVSGADWTAYRRQIAASLSVPCLDARPSIADGARFAGHYRAADAAHELVVASDEAGLFLEPVGTRLLPCGGKTFEIEGLSIALTFEGGEAQPERIICAARLANFDAVWVRVHGAG